MSHIAPSPFDARQRQRHKLRNLGHSLLLLGGMALLLAACGWIVAGALGLVVTILMGGIGLSLGAGASPSLVLKFYGARELPREELEDVHRVVEELSRRALLEKLPQLYYISSPTLNAFSVGTRDEAVIAMTSGLLNRLSLRELAAVLAHELSHVRNNDMKVMALADMISRLTRSMSFLGVLLLAINAPLWLAGAAQVPWLLVLLLIFAPTIGTLLQLALSRTREFDADLDAVGLTRDPAGLAAALQKLERQQGRFWEDILLPGRRSPEPSVLRTHPLTEERVKRLHEMRSEGPFPPSDRPTAVQREHWIARQTPERPRWRSTGLWY